MPRFLEVDEDEEEEDKEKEEKKKKKKRNKKDESESKNEIMKLQNPIADRHSTTDHELTSM